MGVQVDTRANYYVTADILVLRRLHVPQTIKMLVKVDQDFHMLMSHQKTPSATLAKYGCCCAKLVGSLSLTSAIFSLYGQYLQLITIRKEAKMKS